MGVCDHSTLVDEPVFGSPHLVPAGVGIGRLGDSVGEGCREAVLEPHSCSEFAAQSVYEQQSGTEVANVECNSSANPADAPDGCLGLLQNCEFETAMVKRDGTEGGGENVFCLVAEKMSCNECAVGEASLHGSHVESETSCLEKGSLEGCEMPLELLHVNGSLINCAEQNEKDNGLVASRVMEVVDEEHGGLDGIKVDTCNEISPSWHCQIPVQLLQVAGSPTGCVQQNEQRNYEGINGLAVKRVMEVVEGKNEADTCFQISSSQGCETPLELLQMTDPLSNCAPQNEHKVSNSVNSPFAERFTEVVMEKVDVDTCSQILPSQGCGLPSEIIHVAGSACNCAEHDEQKDSNSVNGPSAERMTEVVVEKTDADTCTQILPSQGCAMPLELNNMAGSLSYTDRHDEQNDSNAAKGLPAERVTEFVEQKIDVDTCNQMSPSWSCQLTSESSQVTGSLSDRAQQNEQKDCNSVNGNSAERVVELMEEKSDVLVVVGAQTCTQMLPIEENACNIEKGSSDIASDYSVENSVSLQSCQPSSVVDNGLSKSLDVPDIFGTDVVMGGFKSNIAIDYSGQTDNENKDKVNFDSLSETKSPDNRRLSSRRSTRITKSGRKTQTEKTAKKFRKTANKVPHSRGTIEILFKAARRKRSCISKPARSSIWGLLGNISECFENNQLEVNHVQNQGSRKARGGRRSGKCNKNWEGGSSRLSKGKPHALTSRIRLKVKVGKAVEKSSLNVMVPEVVDASAPDHAIISNYRHELCRGTSLEFSKLSNGVEDKLGEDEPGVRQLQYINQNLEKVKTYPDASDLDGHLAGKDLESTVVLEKSAGNAAEVYLGISSQIEVEALAGAIENRYSDPGTSPDSEVINLIPDAQVGSRVQEDLHDALLTSSKDLAASGDVKRSNLPRTSRKKGRKKDKLPQASNCILDPVIGPTSISNSRVLEKRGHRQKMGDGFYSDETFASSTSRNASGNMLSSNGLSRELLPLSKETDLWVSREALTVESSMEANVYFIPDVGLGSSESQNFEKLLPSTKTKGHKLSKSSKSTGASKCKSEVPDLVKSRKGNACRQRGNPRKSVNKSRVREKGGDCDEVVCKVEGCPETGNYMGDDIGKTSNDDKTASDDKCNLDMVLSGVVEPYLPPRNAWVRCDDCHKWRRIPATLADSIEETNCKWTCKENKDTVFSDCSIPQEKSNSEINAELEISDASCEEDGNEDRLNSKGLERRRSTVTQQSSWMLIKSNLFLHRSRKTQTIDEVMVCHCKPSLDGRLGCGDECLNRMLNIECVQGTCPCGDHCANQQFQKRKYANLKWFRCGKKGYGLQLHEDITKGQFLIEYVGEVLDLHSYEARQKEYASRGHKHFYFMTLNGSEVIDACAKGNLGRFINHSCDPNCRTEKWMVNGEICIGLFALRDIKKGEEVTFDYNYVRVFGAAAKKCVCGSSQCRGFIGGDPLNSEVIVQGDSDEEYPEPVMVREDGKIYGSLDNIISTTSSCDGEEMKIAEASKNRGKTDTSAIAVGQSEISTENEDSANRTASAVSQFQISLEMEDSNGKLPSSVQPVEISLQTEDVTSKPISAVPQEITMEEEIMNKSLCSSSPTTMLSKSLSYTINASRKSESGAVEDDRILSKSRPLMKTSRSSSSVKKGKSKSSSVNASKLQVIANKSQALSNKPKKLLEGSANGRFEAVQEKLGELLDDDGGISKRKDSSRGYLKLLLLTAASGDSGNGEAIQSNRDLSMILDALLKTKSKSVLADIISKNGLRMLHNIMKQYRRDFKKIPILRKLLKVLEFLAVKEILTLELINGGPPCPGMESFRESILMLTEHDDKQVHRIARNFRDKWIPRPVRKISCMERDDGRMEFHRVSNCNRFSASHNYWRDQAVRPTEAIDCVKQSVIAVTPVDAGTQEGCSAPCVGGSSTNGTKTRKRKSRWDQPKEMYPDVVSPQHNEQKVHSILLQECEPSPQNASNMEDDGKQNMHEDVPPGFSSPINIPLVPSNASSTATDLTRPNVSHSKSPFGMVTGHPQERFISRLPVSYGIPLSIVHQFGTSQAETVESWLIAPGMPFRPFPPLPPYPCEKRNASPNAVNPVTTNQPGEVRKDSRGCATYQMDQSTPSTSGASPPDVDVYGANNHHMFKRARGSSYDLGRRYFRQQKRPPWIRNRNGWGFMGNNSRSGMCSIGIGSVANELKSPYCSEDVSNRLESTGNTFYQHSQQQNQL